MIKNIFFSATVVLLLLSGCSTNNGPQYDGSSQRQIKTIETGVVTRSGEVTITDSGSGRTIGTMIGSIVGTVLGHNSGSYLATLGGGVGGSLVGGAVGSEVANSGGSELTVDLDDGREIIIVIDRTDIVAGDMIEIIKNGNKVEKVNILDENFM